MRILILFGLMFISACTQTSATSEPLSLMCEAQCNADGSSHVRFEGIDEVKTDQSKLKLDTPTQTKVGLEDD